jgi:hypothetical protein
LSGFPRTFFRRSGDFHFCFSFGFRYFAFLAFSALNFAQRCFVNLEIFAPPFFNDSFQFAGLAVGQCSLGFSYDPLEFV